MKIHYFCFLTFLLTMETLTYHAAFSQPIVNPVPAPPLANSNAPLANSTPPLANNVQDDNRISNRPFAEERMAAQNFIENVNEARRELTLKQSDIAKQKIIMARNLLPLISRATMAQRRLTRVEFGGGFYANDLSERKSYSPIQTQSLENLTRKAGARWVKNTRAESDALVIYVALDLSGSKAKTYLDQAEKDINKKDFKGAEVQLAQLSDVVIKIDDTVPLVVQARDYIVLADNYIAASNFFGARSSLERANDFLDKMKGQEIYKAHYADIGALYKEIKDLQSAFAKLDADQIKTAQTNLAKWKTLLTGWAGE